MRIILTMILLVFVAPLEAAPPPPASVENLENEVEELASLMSEEQHSFEMEGLEMYPICGEGEKAPDCRTLILFDIGNYMGNSATQYLAMFDPVDANSDFEDLPKVVQSNSRFRAWRFMSVTKIDSTDEIHATFKGARYKSGTLVLQGLTHGLNDSNAVYSKDVALRVEIVNDELSKVEIGKQ